MNPKLMYQIEKAKKNPLFNCQCHNLQEGTCLDCGREVHPNFGKTSGTSKAVVEYKIKNEFTYLVKVTPIDGKIIEAEPHKDWMIGEYLAVLKRDGYRVRYIRNLHIDDDELFSD